MNSAENDNFGRPWLILCEGPFDKYVLHKIIDSKPDTLGGKFLVRFAGSEENVGGRGNIGAWLVQRHALNSSFQDNVKGVLIVSDNDDDPVTSFEEVRAILTNTNGLPVPDHEKEVANVAGYPAIVILMIPEGKPGNMETICLEVAYQHQPKIKKPLNSFVKATPASTWGIGDQSKMRMQAITASICEESPTASLAAHWRRHNDCTMPVDGQPFHSIITFLEDFEALMERHGVVR